MTDMFQSSSTETVLIKIIEFNLIVEFKESKHDKHAARWGKMNQNEQSHHLKYAFCANRSISLCFLADPGIRALWRRK